MFSCRFLLAAFVNITTLRTYKATKSGETGQRLRSLVNQAADRRLSSGVYTSATRPQPLFVYRDAGPSPWAWDEGARCKIGTHKSLLFV